MDIEGNEGPAFESNDWSNPKCRPDVLMAEVFNATLDPDGKRYGKITPEDVLSHNGYKPFPGKFPH